MSGLKVEQSQTDAPSWAKPALGLLLTMFLVLGVTYSMAVPAFEAPDEIGHLGFVRHLRQEQALPVQQVGAMGSAQHPPLYYAVAALVSLPADLTDTSGQYVPNPNFVWRGQGGSEPSIGLHFTAETFPYQGQALFLHLARLASVLMSTGTVLFTVLLGWTIFESRREIGLLAGALVAFTPQFLFISGSVSNDNMLSLTVTASLWLAVRAIKQPMVWRRWLWVGVVLALALLTKVNAAVPSAVIGIMVIVLAIRDRSWRLFFQAALALAAPVLLIAGWWFVRNQLLYGDPLGWRVFDEIYGAVLRQTPLTGQDLRHFFTTQMNSFWGLFGWMTVWAPSWFYSGIRVLSATAAIGFVIFLARRFTSLSGFQKQAVALLVLAILAQEAFMLYSITRMDNSWFQGRYLFIVIGPLMVLASVGLHAITPSKPGLAPTILFGSLLLAVAVYMPVAVISPAYPSITLPKRTLWTVANKTDYVFGDDMIALRGYEVEQRSGIDSVDVVLYWQALRTPDFNYSAFVHLIDPAGQVIVQDDHAPGEAAGYPPLVWRTDDIVADPHTLFIPPNTPTESLRLRLGLYNWETGLQLPVSLHSSVVGTFVIVEELGISEEVSDE
jgi:4-amino-4-deoxy-L-arabinose transferase-like glycosyltransferase